MKNIHRQPHKFCEDEVCKIPIKYVVALKFTCLCNVERWNFFQLKIRSIDDFCVKEEKLGMVQRILCY